MGYLAYFKFIPLIVSVVKAMADQLPDSDGKTRLEAALAFIMKVEGLAAEAAPELTKVVNGVYAALKTAKQVSAPPAAA
jgi:hypothetical protein